MHIPSYGKIFNFGHLQVKEILKSPLLVEEKVDGSQFSAAILDGELVFRSKGAIIQRDNPPGLFAGAVNAFCDREHLLIPGVVYRGESLQKPKHNALTYNRVPKENVVIFDIMVGQEDYMPYDAKKKEADRLGLEVVPILDYGIIKSAENLLDYLKIESFLGGPCIEGVVCKAYGTFGIDGKTLMAKYVREDFKELNASNWKKENKSQSDILTQIGQTYRNENRWNKARIHLDEKGELEHSPRDIGKLMKEVNEDIATECEAEIKEQLWHWAKKHILRQSTAGLPEWWKQELVKESFEPLPWNGGDSEV
jgi:hypothetical protein